MLVDLRASVDEALGRHAEAESEKAAEATAAAKAGTAQECAGQIAAHFCRCCGASTAAAKPKAQFVVAK